MVMAVAKALEDGARSVICASTGNTSASAAAYAAAAGLECVVVLPAGKIAAGKLLQALAFGRASSPCAATSTRRCASCARWPSRTSTRSRSSTRSTPTGSRARRPPRSRSVDDLGRAPDVLAIPVGNAGNISAYWRGLPRVRARPGVGDHAPAMWGFQAAGAAPLVAGHPIERPGDGRDRDPDRQPGLVGPRDRRRATRPAGGSRRSPTTRSSPRTGTLARLEGVFCEPSSAASVAGVDEGRAGRRARPRRARRVRADRATGSRTRRRRSRGSRST